MNQKTALIFHLTHSSISSLEAFNKLAIVCLHKRIAEVEDMGFRIDRTDIPSRNKYGNRNDYLRYSLPRSRANQRLLKKLLNIKAKCETTF